MKINRCFKAIVLCVGALVLSACGGGGGGGGGTTPPPPAASLSVSIAQSAIDVNEGASSTLTYTVNYTGSRTLQYSVSVNGDNAVTATSTETSLTINAAQVTALGVSANVVVSVTDGQLSRTDSVSVNVVNTSFFERQSELLAYAKSLESYALNDTTAYNMMVFATDVDFKLGLLDAGSVNPASEARANSVAAAMVTLSNTVASSIGELESYSSANTGEEADLETIADAIGESVSTYVADMNSAFSTVLSTNGDILPAITFSDLYEAGNNGLASGFSLFIGNPSMGQGQNASFVFSQEFEFIGAILANGNVCAV